MEGRVGKKILLVEDEAIIALAERRSLEKYGYFVDTAASGEKAVTLAASDPDIDLILMDIDLGPGMDGPQAAERILRLRDIPVVFLSSHTEPEIVAKTEAITSYGYVVKNSSITVLDASIKMAFKLHEANRTTAESERKQNALIANISDVIVIIDKDWTNRYKSPNVEKLFGWTVAELVGAPSLDNVHEDDRAAATAFLLDLAERPGASGTLECRYRRKDGVYAWIEITVVNLLEDPVVRGFLGNYHDISDRKRAEQEREFERRFAQKLLESLPGIFYLYTYPELRLVRWNRNHETLLGYGPGEIDGRHIAEWHVPGAAAAVTAAVDQAMEAGFNTIEAALVAKSGSRTPFLMTGTDFEMDGRRFLMGIGIDVSEKVAAEDALRRSEQSLQTTLSSIGDGVIAVDTDGRIVRMNPAAERLTGRTLSEALGRPLGEVFKIVNSDTRLPAQDPVARVLAEGVVVGLANHTALLSASGAEYQIADSAAPIRDGGGPVEGVVLVFSDVTERYRIEAALRESEAALSALFDAMTEMVVLHELIYDSAGRPADYRILDCNPAFTRITGIARDAAVGRLASEVYGAHPAPYLEEFAAVACSGKPYSYTTYYAPMDKHFAISVVSPGPGRFATITTDVTAMKAAEAALRTKGEELDLFFDSSLDLLCFADTEGRFLRVNPEWERVLGYPRSELEGRAFIDFVHPEDRESTAAATAALERRDAVVGFENRYRCADGSWRWIEWRSRSPKGDIIYASARDVTDRRMAEEALRRQVAEKELLLKEVHHRLKNNLASVEGLLSLQLREIEEGPARSALEDATARLESTRILYETLLEGEEFAAGSVGTYLENIVASVLALFRLPADLRVSVEADDFVLPAKALFPLGLIVNELLTNSLKYAFRGRSGGTLAVSLRRAEGIALLTVADDGVGCAADRGDRESRGFGLTLVTMLAEQLGGSYASGGTRGTTASVRFPAP